MAIRSDAAGNERSYLLDMLADDAGCVLEVGCGDGRLTRKYAEGTARVFAVDLPATLPRAASEPLPESVHMAAASGVQLPFPACRFDHLIFALSF